MLHHNKKRKLGRPRDQRKALLRSLALALIDKEKIITTEAKAKELRPFIEKLVSRAKEETLSSKRIVIARLFNQEKASKKLISDIALRYKKRKGGYTRILKLSARRKGDASKMAIIEFV
ncbi:MAG: 50S ribosomal protein L17 [Patescibacteria group bacterium]